MKVALVHDWLTGMRGGEKVLEALCELYPQADIYTLIAVKGKVSSVIETHRIFTSFLQRFPNIEKIYRNFLPIMPFAIEQFDLSEYDLVISTNHCVAKGVKTGRNTMHVSYVFAPMRYVWDQYHEYFNANRSSLLVRTTMKFFRPYLQDWDVKSSRNVNEFLTISRNIHDKVKKFYGRDSRIIFPPVDISGYPKRNEANYYLIVSALVPYKRVDMAIYAFNELGFNLKIVGSGPDMNRLRRIAKPNIEFLGWLDDIAVKEYYSACKAFVFPQEEDFGITAVEAQAAGAPVIAYAGGGSLETVIAGKTGVFFDEATKDSLKKAVLSARNMNFDLDTLVANAKRFSKNRFKDEILNFITSKMSNT